MSSGHAAQTDDERAAVAENQGLPFDDGIHKSANGLVGPDGVPVVLLQPEDYRAIDRELAKYPPEGRQSAVMAALAIAQERIGWVSPQVIDDMARYLELPAIAVWEVASFYNMYDTRPVGTFKIGVCTCLPCALRDGVKAGEYLKEKLGIGYGETTADGRFTLIETECLGACGDAPVCLVNNKRMESFMDNARLDALVDELGQPSAAAAAPAPSAGPALQGAGHVAQSPGAVSSTPSPNRSPSEGPH